MDIEDLKQALMSLSIEECEILLSDIEREPEVHSPLLGKRKELFDNKIGNCPHCESKKYRKHGIDKGSQRYYCRNCKRTFTEFTGTWVSGLHKKELVIPYLNHMKKEYSLDKIKVGNENWKKLTLTNSYNKLKLIF